MRGKVTAVPSSRPRRSTTCAPRWSDHFGGRIGKGSGLERARSLRDRSMSRLLPFLIGLMLASLLGLGSVFHVSDEGSSTRRVATPGLVLSMASASEPTRDQRPVGVSPWLPHAHSECHGDHLIVPAKAIISQMKSEDAYSAIGQRISEGMTAAPTLRPPKL